MGRPAKNFEDLMIEWNITHDKHFADVDAWLVYLESKHSIRNMARLLNVDRGVLTRILKEL